MVDKREELFDRITSRVKDTDDCILYPHLGTDGYGDIQYYNEDRRKRHYRAHRLSYEIANNVILTKEQLVCHSCDTPACINPKHLFVGTNQDNCDDKMKKGRGVYLYGKDNPSYKHGYYSIHNPTEKPKTAFELLFGREFTKEAVSKIKQAIRDKGNKSLKQLSEELGVKYQTLRDLNCGRIYKEVLISTQ